MKKVVRTFLSFSLFLLFVLFGCVCICNSPEMTFDMWEGALYPGGGFLSSQAVAGRQIHISRRLVSPAQIGACFYSSEKNQDCFQTSFCAAWCLLYFAYSMLSFAGFFFLLVEQYPEASSFLVEQSVIAAGGGSSGV